MNEANPVEPIRGFWSSWAIVQIRSGSEEIAEKRLRQSGYRVYLPHYRKLLAPHGHNKKPVPVMRPLFVGLVFVQDWRGWPQFSIPGAMGLMRGNNSERIAKLNDDDMAKLMLKERAGVFDKGLRPPANGIWIPDISIGDEVEFEMAGQRIMGVLEDLSDNGKAVIRAIVFGQQTPIRDVDARDLQLVAS